ncbi:hypothetical protein FJ872_31995 [Mesorhizobium sp. B2-5-9]|uniref:hypothetical protein n=1 Tax=Mesorhizobium sp. B2-5-9 TaxID=2589921 RepID=UPI00112A93D2|nr:hypothetical protein [Mesorhizobium sp. B2-5-9]TPJ97637.1 hypothetical protein FJ872_31995 [Mesorhizobium sp. B2-5-9]
MFGLLDWIKIGGGAAAGAIVAGALAYSVGHWRGVDEGKALERTAALQRSMDLIKERNETNAKVNDLDDAGLCAALGGKWMPDIGCQ